MQGVIFILFRGLVNMFWIFGGLGGFDSLFNLQEPFPAGDKLDFISF